MRTQQKMIDSQSGIALIRISEVVVKSINNFIWKQRSDGISPTLGNQLMKCSSDFRSEKRVFVPTLGFVNIEFGGHHIKIAYQNYWNIEIYKGFGTLLQAIKPFQFIVEFGTWRRISV